MYLKGKFTVFYRHVKIMPTFALVSFPREYFLCISEIFIGINRRWVRIIAMKLIWSFLFSGKSILFILEIFIRINRRWVRIIDMKLSWSFLFPGESIFCILENFSRMNHRWVRTIVMSFNCLCLVSEGTYFLHFKIF